MRFSDTVRIAGREISPQHPPYVIAELSANHDGDLGRARVIIDAAAAAGAAAIKLQSYRPDTITIDHDGADFRIDSGRWAGRSLYELYEEAHLPWEWHAPLFEHARRVGITPFSSPFDDTAIDMLEALGCPAYKIASFEAVDLSLIRRAAATGKPLIVSSGMADETEIGEALEAARSGGCRELVLLHCVSGYPASAAEYNLHTLADMRQRFGVPVGLSDHTLDNATALAAVALGACVIEKHVTLDRDGGGPDDGFSLEPSELESLCTTSRTAWQALGTVSYARTESERGNTCFRRSLYAVRDIAVGELLTAENVRSIRPGFGLAPKHLGELLGRRARASIARGTPMSRDLAD